MKPKQQPRSLPACSKWGVWVGVEIEGSDALGEPTVFIRRLPPALYNKGADLSVLTHNGKYSRVWVCKEFEEWDMVRAFFKVFKKVVLEVSARTYGNLPRDIIQRAQLYYKLPVRLKPGDVVCVGPAFEDESFVVGTGKKVTPDQYGKDVCIYAG